MFDVKSIVYGNKINWILYNYHWLWNIIGVGNKSHGHWPRNNVYIQLSDHNIIIVVVHIIPID